jgi:hypothetical protein
MDIPPLKRFSTIPLEHFVVVGSLEQFVGEHGVNREHLRSFELFRRNTIQPEIVTYDELFERAKHIIAANEA